MGQCPPKWNMAAHIWAAAAAAMGGKFIYYFDNDECTINTSWAGGRLDRYKYGSNYPPD